MIKKDFALIKKYANTMEYWIVKNGKKHQPEPITEEKD